MIPRTSQGVTYFCRGEEKGEYQKKEFLFILFIEHGKRFMLILLYRMCVDHSNNVLDFFSNSDIFLISFIYGV